MAANSRHHPPGYHRCFHTWHTPVPSAGAPSAARCVWRGSSAPTLVHCRRCCCRHCCWCCNSTTQPAAAATAVRAAAAAASSPGNTGRGNDDLQQTSEYSSACSYCVAVLSHYSEVYVHSRALTLLPDARYCALSEPCLTNVLEFVTDNRSVQCYSDT